MTEINAYKIYLHLKEKGVLLRDVERIDNDSAYILCEWNDEYVIWTMDLKTMDRYWGHYYDNAIDVTEKYAQLIR